MLRQPLKFHGGKAYLARWLQGLAPDHTHRVYGYAGGMAEAWNWRCENVSEVANDVNGYIINFYRVLRYKFPQFRRLVATTPFSRVEWQTANERMAKAHAEVAAENYEPEKPHVEAAYWFYIWNRQSMAGRMDCFSPITKLRTRGKRNAEVNAWLSAIDGLREIKNRLDNFVLEHDEAINVIRREDTPTTLFYLDPPYLYEQSERTTPDVYECEMSPEQHQALVDFLAAGVQGKVMLSGYRTRMYDKALKHWNRHEKLIDNKAAKAEMKRMRIECVYVNF